MNRLILIVLLIFVAVVSCKTQKNLQTAPVQDPEQITEPTKEVIEEVKRFFGEKVYKTVIPRTVKLTEAPGFGKPIALYAKDSTGAKKYNHSSHSTKGPFH